MKFQLKIKAILIPCMVLLLAQASHAQNGAAVVSMSVPPAVAPGANFEATITMRNTGTTSWTVAGMYALGAESPRNNTLWRPNGRVALPTDPVGPGESAVFTGVFTAPATPGIYNFAWSMVQDGVGWFGLLASQQIRVGNGRFTPGDLVVMQAVATASDAISANGAALVLNNFSLSSLTNTFTTALPLNGTDALITGSSPFTGMIDLSTDGHFVVVGGYNTPLPFSASVEAAGSPVPRAIGTVNSGGHYVLGAKTTTGFAGGTFRGVVSDGDGNFWGGAQNSGIYYFGTNDTPKQISPAGLGAIRNMIMINGRPHFSTSQFPITGSFGIAGFTNVAPTTAQEPVLVLDSGNAVTGASGTANPKGFYVSSNLTTAYVVDLRPMATGSGNTGGGIYRYNGTGTGLPGSWTYVYTITNNLFPNGGAFQEVVADFSGEDPIIYATAGASASGVGAGTNLVRAVDTGAATTTFTVLANAPAGTAFRGLTFAPKLVSLTIARAGSDVVITWEGGGTLLSSGTVTGPYLPVAGSPTSPHIVTPTPGTSQFYTVGSP